mgnify:CR=1 FL=1
MTSTEAGNRIKSNNNHSRNISWYRRNALDMARAIETYFEEKQIILPSNYVEYKVKKEALFQNYLDSNKLDNDLIDLEEYYQELIKLRYDLLKSRFALYAVFPGQANYHEINSPFYSTPSAPKSQILATQYSKHRFDPVWNYRKSQLIRNKYRAYLSESKIHTRLHPAHLMLTVPHRDGKFMGEEFYVKEITNCFNKLRKTPFWIKYVFAGEYGVEVKKSPNGHGLHIHIHSLVFQTKNISVNDLRDKIADAWNKITGSTRIHYETLYVYKKDASGNFITDSYTKFTYEMNEDGTFKNKPYERSRKVVNDQGELQTVTEIVQNKILIKKEIVIHKKKFYLDRKDGPTSSEEILNEYVSGILECIKYHFKNDTCVNEHGEYDIELMIQVLNNTKKVRLYSRFGAFYKLEALNFNNLSKETNEQTDDELEEEVMASTDNVLANLINPHTKQPADPKDYFIAFSKPHHIRHETKKGIVPCEPVLYNTNAFYECNPNLEFKVIVKKLMMNRVSEILTVAESQRYYVNTKPQPKAKESYPRIKFDNDRMEVNYAEN